MQSIASNTFSCGAHTADLADARFQVLSVVVLWYGTDFKFVLQILAIKSH